MVPLSEAERRMPWLMMRVSQADHSAKISIFLTPVSEGVPFGKLDIAMSCRAGT